MKLPRQTPTQCSTPSAGEAPPPAWSSPESISTQTIVFGVVTSVLTLIAVYLSYRQLQNARRLRSPPAAAPNPLAGPKYIFLSPRVYTLQQ